MLSWMSTSSTVSGSKGKGKEQSRTLVVVGYVAILIDKRLSSQAFYRTYSIGKERIVKGEILS